MNILRKNVNILFLIFIRKSRYNLFVIKTLASPIFRQKILEALTVIHWSMGCKPWYVCSKIYRENAPAVIHFVSNINKFEKYVFSLTWYNTKGVHRDGGPAIIYFDCGVGKNKHLVNETRWCQNGTLHRDNGPAIIDIVHGYRGWYRHGKPIKTTSL